VNIGLPRQLSHKYLGEEPLSESPDVVRLIVRVQPWKIGIVNL
jgi:hypothetical protein